jgi:Ran GTPase-activating protein (RanGAP) involved in mRNA processing and transport
MCQALIGEKCRLNIFKIKGINITNLEGKVLQFVLMKNKSLHTLDISGNAVMAHEVVALFQHARIRSLDISDNQIPDLGMRALLRHAMQSNMLHELHVDGNHLTAHSLRLLRKMRQEKGMNLVVPRECCCNICHSP